MGITITIAAKTKVEYEGKSYGEHSSTKDVVKPTSLSEAAQMDGDKQVLEYYWAAKVIRIQASMREDITDEVLDANGVVRATKRAIPPEVKAINDAIKALPAEKQADARKKVQALLATL